MLNRKNNLVSYYNPFREMEMLERSLFGTPVTTSMSFRTDITDEGNMYKLEADIQLNVENEVLTIHAERHSEHEDEQKRGKYVCYERVSGSVGRSFDISEIDADKITASYKDGVLTLLLPKKEKVVPTAKRLEIQ